MKAFPYSAVTHDAQLKRQFVLWRQAMPTIRSVISKYSAPLAILAVLAYLLWTTVAIESLWLRGFCCFLLIIISTLLGIRLGADSAATYLQDVHRLNKVLADQNEQLQDANAMLLRELSADSSPKPTSQDSLSH